MEIFRSREPGEKFRREKPKKKKVIHSVDLEHPESPIELRAVQMKKCLESDVPTPEQVDFFNKHRHEFEESRSWNPLKPYILE